MAAVYAGPRRPSEAGSVRALGAISAATRQLTNNPTSTLSIPRYPTNNLGDNSRRPSITSIRLSRRASDSSVRSRESLPIRNAWDCSAENIPITISEALSPTANSYTNTNTKTIFRPLSRKSEDVGDCFPDSSDPFLLPIVTGGGDTRATTPKSPREFPGRASSASLRSLDLRTMATSPQLLPRYLEKPSRKTSRTPHATPVAPYPDSRRVTQRRSSAFSPNDTLQEVEEEAQAHALGENPNSNKSLAKGGAVLGNEHIPPLDKIPTNEFIERFLEEDDILPTSHVARQLPEPRGADYTNRGQSAPPRRDSKSSACRGGRRARSRVEVEPLPDENDDLETVLDVKERLMTYDETGQRTYEAACRRFRALPSASFRRKLAYATSIDMKHYGTGPRGAQAIAIPMLNNTKVTSLSMKGNDLSQDGIRYITRMMGENNYITDLDLSDNHLKTYGAKLINEMILENVNLRRLDLSGNNFTDSDAKIILKAVEEHQELKCLNLGHNEIGDISGPVIKHLISENGTLQELDLSWNHIRMKAAVDIAKGLKENVGLKALILSWNGCADQGAKELASALKSSTLTTLDLTSNRIYSEGFLSLVKATKDADDLTELKVGRNPIPEDAAIAGLEFLLHLEEIKLQKLDLAECIYGSKFASKLAEVQEKYADFECPNGYTDSYGKRKLKQYNAVEEALGAMKAYCVDHNINIVELFARFDQDGSMSVTHDEFKEGLRDAKIPLTQVQVDELINALDQDGDGEIDFSELVLGAEMYDAETKPS